MRPAERKPDGAVRPRAETPACIYTEVGKYVSGPARPAVRPSVRTRDALWNAPWNALRMVGAGCELDAETQGIDVTRRAESIGEGIEF